LLFDRPQIGFADSKKSAQFFGLSRFFTPTNDVLDNIVENKFEMKRSRYGAIG
jgi:hypothetical protein